VGFLGRFLRRLLGLFGRVVGLLGRPRGAGQRLVGLPWVVGPVSQSNSDNRGPAVLRLGVVGCGRFAGFAVEEFRRLPGVIVGAVADIDVAAAQAMARECGAVVVEPDVLLASPEIDLVYIATPPAAHHLLARSALDAGRHVLVEKPLSTSVGDARDLAAVAIGRGLVCAANLVQRYGPLADTVREFLRMAPLGRLVHGLLLNEASDAGLHRHHWFWNRNESGGIFVEHAGHFFDLVASWLGPGEVVSASRGLRPEEHGGNGNGEVEEQAGCTCRYRDGVLFHFEHGFHQPAPLDRLEIRLVFERGELRLYDWIPTRGEVLAVVEDEAADRLVTLLPDAKVQVVERLNSAAARTTATRLRGRFREFEAAAVVRIGFGTGLTKNEAFAEAVRGLAADQFARIRDPDHARRLTEADAVAAVAMSSAADRLARAPGRIAPASALPGAFVSG
jgi:predicted dehydrogenase